MDKLLKLFPFMPKKSEAGKFVVALLFYILGVGVILSVLTVVLSLTVILAPAVAIVVPVGGLYSFAGFIFAILCFAGVISK